MRKVLATAVAAASASVLLPVLPNVPSARAAIEPEPVSAVNVSHVANLAYEGRYGQDLPFGTDIELREMTLTDTVTVAGKGKGKKATTTTVVTKAVDVAFAGTYENGLQIVDVTDPTAPVHLAVYDCSLAQGDVQVFTREDGRTYVAYTADDYSSQTRPESGCYQDVGITEDTYGTFIVDVTDPRTPTTVSFVPFERGSHNQSVHPSGRYLYNSNSDLGGLAPASIEVVDITDLRDPQPVTELPLLTGLDSHDITFSEDGSRAYSAALTHTLVLDTTDPAAPAIIGRIVDPTINIHHQADPVTLVDPVLGERTFLVVTDELAGAAGNLVCPGGGLHVYDITGPLEQAPVKVGFFDIPDISPTTGSSITCTSHVLRMYPEQGLMTIAWYARGIRVIDISGLVGASVGGLPTPGMQEVGHLWFDDSDLWSAKALRIEPDGSFYAFGNDINRGLDVFRFEAAPAGTAAMATGASRWVGPDDLGSLPVVSPLQPGDPVVVSCLLAA
jgi:hypothetical protein